MIGHGVRYIFFKPRNTQQILGLGPHTEQLSFQCVFSFFLEYVDVHVLDDRLTSEVPPLPHTLVGTALMFMLTFRTNNAYQRWWDARSQLAIVQNGCRELSRLACGYISDWEVRRLRQNSRSRACFDEKL